MTKNRRVLRWTSTPVYNDTGAQTPPRVAFWEASRAPLQGAYQITNHLGTYLLTGAGQGGQRLTSLPIARQVAEADYIICLQLEAAKFNIALANLPNPKKETEDV